MSTTAGQAPRSIADLSPADRERLEMAHRSLRETVERYDRFLSTKPLKNGVPVYSDQEMGAAQDDVKHAEDELWRLREELLGWARPSWAPTATLVSDWFSEEDRIYDQA